MGGKFPTVPHRPNPRPRLVPGQSAVPSLSPLCLSRPDIPRTAAADLTHAKRAHLLDRAAFADDERFGMGAAGGVHFEGLVASELFTAAGAEAGHGSRRIDLVEKKIALVVLVAQQPFFDLGLGKVGDQMIDVSAKVGR